MTTLLSSETASKFPGRMPLDATVHLGRTVHTNALQTAREVFVTATQAIALVVNRDTRVITVARPRTLKWENEDQQYTELKEENEKCNTYEEMHNYSN
uniref:Uncharacterized protein n=1 Tax=Magallana gigas TaxID=29159 RepID=K1RHI7_MAGGI